MVLHTSLGVQIQHGLQNIKNGSEIKNGAFRLSSFSNTAGLSKEPLGPTLVGIDATWRSR